MPTVRIRWLPGNHKPKHWEEKLEQNTASHINSVQEEIWHSNTDVGMDGGRIKEEYVRDEMCELKMTTVHRETQVTNQGRDR